MMSATRLWIRPLRDSAFRSFHSTPLRAGGSFLNLSGLSVSRESRFLSKERGIPRTEFSPHLELIRSSEVDPFTGRDASSSLSQLANSKLPSDPTDQNLLSLGYLMKELETARIVNTKSEAAFRELHAKFLRREKEAALLAILTAVLTLSILFSQEMDLLFEPVVRWRQIVIDDITRMYTSTMTNYNNSSKIEERRSIETADFEHDISIVPPLVATPRTRWSRMLWATPD